MSFIRSTSPSLSDVGVMSSVLYVSQSYFLISTPDERPNTPATSSLTVVGLTVAISLLLLLLVATVSILIIVILVREKRRKGREILLMVSSQDVSHSNPVYGGGGGIEAILYSIIYSSSAH